LEALSFWDARGRLANEHSTHALVQIVFQDALADRRNSLRTRSDFGLLDRQGARVLINSHHE